MKNLKNKAYNWLRWSEKYTRTDMVYLARGGSWLTLQHTISVLISFLLALAFANLLPKETYGIYRFVLAGIAILSIPTLSGMNTAITQAVAQGEEGMVYPALRAKIKWGLLGGLAGIGLSTYYFVNGNSTLSLAFLIGSIFFPAMEAFNVYANILQGKELFRKYFQYGTISQVIATLLLLLGLIYTNNVLIILSIYFVSWTIVRFIFLKITLKSVQKKEYKTSNITFGKHLSLIDTLGSLATYLDKLLVFHFLGAAELAVYALATMPPEQIKSLFKNIPRLALPKLSQKTQESISGSLYYKLVMLTALGTAATLAYIVVAPFVYKTFFPNYIDSIPFSQLFALSLIFIPASQFLGSAFLSQPKLIKRVYTINIVTSVLLIVLLLSLGYLYGIVGIIWARIIYLFASLALGILMWRINDTKQKLPV